eukprot:scaffold68425_cov48-Phaeocystis_antarctica.AAC.1
MAPTRTHTRETCRSASAPRGSTRKCCSDSTPARAPRHFGSRTPPTPLPSRRLLNRNQWCQ